MTLSQHLAEWAQGRLIRFRNWWRRLGAERHVCPDRGAQSDSPMYERIVKGVGPHDYWERRPNGDRCCTWCGSLHPDDFQRLCEAACDDGSGVQIERSTKGYKTYVDQPGVRNAGEGGIKFYHWHRARDDTADFAAFEAAYVNGVKASRRRFMAVAGRGAA